MKIEKYQSTIRKIGVFKYTMQICGFRLIDHNGDFVLNEKWYNGSGGEWEVHEIPLGSEIIGLKCNNSLKFSIPTLSFILWERGNYRELDQNPLAISKARLERHQQRKREKQKRREAKMSPRATESRPIEDQ